MATIPKPNTPLARPLMVGSEGIDVIAIKRALSRAGYMQWGTFTKFYGPFCRVAVHNFQKDHGLKPAGYGIKTHQALLQTRRKGSKVEWAYDNYSIHLMHEEYILLHESPELRIRKGIISMARYLLSHRYSIAYSQSRPFAMATLGGRVPTYLDCSGYVTVDHYGGGARRNPNVMQGIRLPWNGEGYTGTLLAGGARTDRDKLKPGDFVFYGFSQRSSSAFPYGAPTHVALWEGVDDMVLSMGHYPMGRYYFRYRHDINCYVTYDVD